MNIKEITEQYRGSTLAALVGAHMKTMNEAILPQAIRGTFIEFNEDYRPLLEDYTDTYISSWCNKEHFEMDLADIFIRSIEDISQLVEQNGLELSEKRVFDLFHIMAMKLALKAHTDPEIQQLLDPGVPPGKT